MSLNAEISLLRVATFKESRRSISCFSEAYAWAFALSSIWANWPSKKDRSSPRRAVSSERYCCISSRQSVFSVARFCSNRSIFSAMFFSIICSAERWSRRSLKLAVMMVNLSPRSRSNLDAAIVSWRIFSINSGAAPS